MPERVIAIDGPAGSGKSTAARRLAEALGFTYVNTGAMYRAVAFLAKEGGIDLTHAGPVAEVARLMNFAYRLQDGRQHFIVNGADHTDALFTAALTEQLKPVVNNPAVRAALVQKMRTAARALLAQGVPGVVMEGRNIGTVVFPDAVLKFYIHANLEERARRRAAELQARGEAVDLEGLRQQIRYRDDTDRARAIGPLVQAADALDVDTTHLDENDTLRRLLQEARARGLAESAKIPPAPL